MIAGLVMQFVNKLIDEEPELVLQIIAAAILYLYF